MIPGNPVDLEASNDDGGCALGLPGARVSGSTDRQIVGVCLSIGSLSEAIVFCCLFLLVLFLLIGRYLVGVCLSTGRGCLP